MVAPFFIFQVLCLFLWSLDEYWYYSLVTLAMLMTFEGVLCRQRQSSLEMLRNMRRPPILVYVMRQQVWELVTSDNVYPGDVVSLASEPVTGVRKGAVKTTSGSIPVLQFIKLIHQYCQYLPLRSHTRIQWSLGLVTIEGMSGSSHLTRLSSEGIA